MKYFNVKRSDGVETIDEIDKSEFPTLKAYRLEVLNRLECYRSIGENIYLSQRCTKNWKDRQQRKVI